MNWEIYLKRKACIDDAQSARKKVAYVTAGNVQQAKEIALARPEKTGHSLLMEHQGEHREHVNEHSQRRQS